MNRVSFYVDGFNLYHIIDKYCPRCKWLDLRKMFCSVIPASDSISEISYFSALAHWKPERVTRHRAYIEALRSTEVSIILGRFKEKDRKCLFCRKAYKAHEEKQTDVHIALKMLEDGIDNRFDTAILVSGDTDFVPVLSTLKRRFSDKRIGIMLPIGSRARELQEVADFFIKMKRRHLTGNQFPHLIETPKGKIEIPEKWR